MSWSPVVRGTPQSCVRVCVGILGLCEVFELGFFRVGEVGVEIVNTVVEFGV